MIVIGVDPGGRHTGIVVVDDQARGDRTLLHHLTVERATGDRTLTDVPQAYIDAVTREITAALNAGDIDLIAVEGVERPKGHAAGRTGHLIDPSGLLATAQVLGAVRGTTWPVPVVVIPPGGNGTFLPPNAYPTAIRGTTAGHDNRRHMRSAYDVAMQAQAHARLARITR